MNNSIKVGYEWDVETWLDGEVEDHDHSEKLTQDHADLAKLEGESRLGTKFLKLVLVRDEYTEEYGVSDREWAYVTHGRLPEFFSDAFQREGSKVPIRFHRELAKVRASD